MKKDFNEIIIEKLEALKIGIAAMKLGAGREDKDDTVDLGVGIEIVKKVGDVVNIGDTLAIIYANDKGIAEATKYIYDAYKITNKFVDKRPIVLDIVKQAMNIQLIENEIPCFFDCAIV